jgi:hypothetical protein
LSDADGDGIPNIVDPDYKKSSSRQTTRPMVVNASETDAVGQGNNGNGAVDPTHQPRR